MQILCEVFTIHFGISKDTRKDGRSAIWQVETISLVELGKSIKVVIHKIDLDSLSCLEYQTGILVTLTSECMESWICYTATQGSQCLNTADSLIKRQEFLEGNVNGSTWQPTVCSPDGAEVINCQ